MDWSPAEVMSICWPSIGPYLDVASLVSVSMSCRPLRGAAIDAESGKLRATVVEIDGGGGGGGDAIAVAADRALSLLGAVHFPSIIRLGVAFPPNGNAEVDEEGGAGDDARSAILPLLATSLSAAWNMEDLKLDACSLVAREGSGAIQRGTYDLLGENLSRCVGRTRRLRRLTIFSEERRLTDGDDGDDDDGRGPAISSQFGPSLLAAMVPVVRSGLDSLEEVTLLLGNQPSRADHPDAIGNFFGAVLRLRNLRAFRIQLRSVNGPRFGGLVKACAALDALPSESLEEVSVMVADEIFPDDDLPSISPLLSLLDSTSTLENFFLYVPPECWDDRGIAELGHVFGRNRDLDNLVIRFDGYEDYSGRLLDYFLAYVQERMLTPYSRPRKLALLDLGYVDNISESYETLRGWHSPHDGESCVREDDFGWTFLVQCA